MSEVTSVILVVQEYGDVTEDMLGENLRKDVTKAGQRLRKMREGEDQWVGGHKFLESELWAGGLNYIPGDELEEWFKSLPWGPHGRAFLVWETNGERFGFKGINWVGV